MELSSDFKEKNNDIINFISPYKNKKDLKDIPQNLTLFSLKTPLTERDTSNLKINSFRKRNIIIDNDYINSIEEIKTKFLKAAKRHERYFDNNKYGYDAFKLKYNYLKKKYFKYLP